ncbi:MAG TPA: hypothetical protein VGS19_00075 [Streptosporangiaceae bacterium]|nr:hypothetical protein [Streptosporangiaceae bacterium]
MCDDHAVGTAGAAGRPGVSRRRLLSGAAALGAAAAGAAAVGGCSSASPTVRDTAVDGLSGYSMAMHVHSSFSEQSGSMDSQLYQAARNAVDVLWWTEHDSRMLGMQYCQVVNFTTLNSRPGKGELVNGTLWQWVQRTSGPLAGVSIGGLVSHPVSPNDHNRQGSLQLTAQSLSTQPASYGYYANSQPAGWNYRDNLTGQTLHVDVLLRPGWREGYLELLINSSYHEATGGRPAGVYSLSYRFVPAGVAGGRSARGNTGVVTIPVKPGGRGGWYSAALSPADDIAALWPDVDSRDFALWELTLNAVSTGEQVSGYFGYLRFDRTKTGDAFLAQQLDMAARLARKYPTVAQRQGLEVSWKLPHMSWFANSVSMPDYTGITPQAYPEFMARTVVPHIHSIGGLVSYNHPFGYSFVMKLHSKPVQDKILKHLAAAMLPAKSVPAALGADMLEVGYPNREGVDLAHHIALWDIMSRNGAFLTGLGASDDHWGQNWYGSLNNWTTSVWAKSTAVPDLLKGLAGGRAWFSSLSGYQGSMDLVADGSATMGSVSVSPARSRKLTAFATHLPPSGSLQVVQGVVDYADHANITADRKIIGHYTTADLAPGAVTQTVDTSASSFVRTQILDATGQVVAMSNPIWLLRSAPPGGIPAARGA